MTKEELAKALYDRFDPINPVPFNCICGTQQQSKWFNLADYILKLVKQEKKKLLESMPLSDMPITQAPLVIPYVQHEKAIRRIHKWQQAKLKELEINNE